MADNKRTVAFQVPADLFEQFKAYLEKNHIKQNAFFLDCIQRALADEAENNALPVIGRVLFSSNRNDI